MHTCSHFCVRTTLDIDDWVLRQAERRALETGETLTRFIEVAIRSRLAEAKHLPPYRLTLLAKRGEARPDVNWDDRESIYEHIEGRS